ncbi:hypothetical protein M2325_001220 [Methanococcus voltae PS]|uniref:Uncharacterized protein n=1 Tax=Methanococcus voltae PS TaxID=523842 RepID=A0ABT2EXX0_METVO|nr:hypothetical protein [Methanococcus voltae]MCS3922524.1 hypothetical protein [Methanococcus voltae PS]
MSKFTKITASLLVMSICIAGVFAIGFDNSNGQRMKTNALQIENCDCTQSGAEDCQNYEHSYNYNHNHQHNYKLNNANCTCDYNCENRSEFKNNNYQHNYKNNRNQKNNNVGAIESAIGSIF